MLYEFQMIGDREFFSLKIDNFGSNFFVQGLKIRKKIYNVFYKIFSIVFLIIVNQIVVNLKMIFYNDLAIDRGRRLKGGRNFF